MRGDRSYMIEGGGGKSYDSEGRLTQVSLGYSGIVLTFARADKPGDKPNSVKIVRRSGNEDVPGQHFKQMVQEAKKLLWPPKSKGTGI